MRGCPVRTVGSHGMVSTPAERPVSDWSVGDFIWAILGGVIGAFVAGLPAVFLPGQGETLLVLLVGQYAGHFLTIRHLARRKSLDLEELGLSVHPVDGTAVFLGVALQFGLLLLFAPLARLLGTNEPSQAIGDMLAASDGLVVRALLVVMIALVVPVVEETMFRGILLRVATRWRGARAGLVTSAAVFATFHLLGITGNVLQSAALVLPQIFIVGVVLARLTQRRGRLGPAIFTHAGFNLVAALVIVTAA